MGGNREEGRGRTAALSLLRNHLHHNRSVLDFPDFRDFSNKHTVGTALVASASDMSRPYTRAELWADGIVHAVALVLAVTGFVLLAIYVGLQRNGIELSATIIYGVGLVSMLSFSFAYNMATHVQWKSMLRRLDHSGIYLMIAGTYTPLLTQMHDALTAWAMGIVVWAGAIAGIVLKFALPRRFENGSVVIYLVLSWVAVLAIKPITDSLPVTASTLLLAGGALYSFGVVFYLWERLKYQRAIWHSFVVTAASCHFAAIATCLIGAL
jgi:hemolysin III